jgi:hypothetical protein
MGGQIILSFCHADPNFGSLLLVDQAYFTAEIVQVGNALQ